MLRVDRDLLRQGYAAKWLRCAFSGFPIGDVMGFVAPMFPTAAALDPKRHARKLQRDRAKKAKQAAKREKREEFFSDDSVVSDDDDSRMSRVTATVPGPRNAANARRR